MHLLTEVTRLQEHAVIVWCIFLQRYHLYVRNCATWRMMMKINSLFQRGEEYKFRHIFALQWQIDFQFLPLLENEAEMTISSKKRRQQWFSVDFQLTPQRPSDITGWLCPVCSAEWWRQKTDSYSSFPTECRCPAQRVESPAKLKTAAGVKALSLYDVFFVYKKPEVQFMHGSNHTEHCTK
jgi:hypothetical protein